MLNGTQNALSDGDDKNCGGIIPRVLLENASLDLVEQAQVASGQQEHAAHCGLLTRLHILLVALILAPVHAACFVYRFLSVENKCDDKRQVHERGTECMDFIPSRA